MLISEIKGWQWLITWDNPLPANSSTMLNALQALGRITKVQTKTTVLLAPLSGVKARAIRAAIRLNLNPSTGNSAYVNLRSGRAWHLSTVTNFQWEEIT